MAYTAADLQAVEQAIVELGTGKLVATVRLGEMEVRYSRTQLAQLHELRRRILQELNPRPRVVLTTTSKGL